MGLRALVGPAPAEMHQGFLLSRFRRILPGIFLEDFLSTFKAQIKHINNFSIKNSGSPKPPPKKIVYVWVFLYFEGKGGPKHKEFMGSRAPWRGGV